MKYNGNMSKELTTISPEGLEVANAYLSLGNIQGVSELLNVPEYKVTQLLDKREVKRYIDLVYLDTGYRNRNNIASLLDEMIASKLEEAAESGIFTKKDLFDLLEFAHKMRMDELKQKKEEQSIKNQTNVQINDGSPFGSGNYAVLMEKLLRGESGK